MREHPMGEINLARFLCFIAAGIVLAWASWRIAHSQLREWYEDLSPELKGVSGSAVLLALLYGARVSIHRCGYDNGAPSIALGNIMVLFTLLLLFWWLGRGR